MNEIVDNAELLNDFVEESLASLRGTADQLRAYQHNPADEEPIHAVFRAIHSVKGCAGFLNLLVVKEFSHALENTLDDVRKHKLTPTDELCRALIDGFDLLDAMLQRIGGSNIDLTMNAAEESLLERVARAALAASVVKPDADSLEARLLDDLLALQSELDRARFPAAVEWSQRVGKMVDYLNTAEEDAAGDGAEDEAPATPIKVIPTAVDWATREFVLGTVDITARVRDLQQPFLALAAGTYKKPQGDAYLAHLSAAGEWFAANNGAALAAACREAGEAFGVLHRSPLDPDATLFSIVWEKLAAALEPCLVVPAAVTVTSTEQKQKPDASKAKAASGNAKSRLLRVREEKLDEFLNHVSSLFITCELYKDVQTRLIQPRASTEELLEEFRQINRTFVKQTCELQKSVLSLRRVNAGTLFSKFPSMARTLAGQLDKQIDVQVFGEEVEIDKSLVEELDSPLTHMIRNVVDHGIEKPDQREAAGKTPQGNLTLKAELTKTHVIITIQDDGRGIDPQRLRRKVVEKGLLTQTQADALTDQEAVELIFMAGLSTAEQVSEISGRGVGLDVVRTTLREHNGDVQVESTLGQGTKFRLEVPLREAVLVINGLLIEQSGETLVLPFENVHEICEVSAGDLKPGQGKRFISIREQLFDAISLAEILDLPAKPTTPDDKVILIQVSSKKHGACCLVVDRILGHRQVVVNSLRDIFPVTEKVAGVAQLGGGRLALVLSVPDMLKSLCQGTP